MRFVFALSLLAGLARAEVESEQVKAGVKAFNDADFDRCIQVLGTALGESLTREEQIVTYRTRAFCHSAADHAEEARDDFVALLRIDEKAELDQSVAPKMRALFEEARALVATGAVPLPQAPSLPTLTTTVPNRVNEGAAFSASASHPGGVAQKMQLFYRSRGEGKYQLTTAAIGADGKATAEVPGSAVRPPALELYLTALDAGGAAVARAGSFSEPIIVEVTAKPTPKKRTWVWGIVGGIAVAGLAVGLGVGLTVGRPSGNADLTIVAPQK
jgi:hypothetical protein